MSMEYLQALAAAWRDDPGFQIPPDAGDSVLGAFGLRNPAVAWILAHNPEVLAMTPRELVRGLRAPSCPHVIISKNERYAGMSWKCGRQMKLRLAEAEGRRDARLVWRCYQHDPPATQELGPPKAAPVKDGNRNVSTAELIAATNRGETLDYQRLYTWSAPELIYVKPKRRSRGRAGKG